MIRKDWNLEAALRAGDRAVGVSVLHPRYIRMKDMPVSGDLDSLWSQLGIQPEGSSVRFDNGATLAAIRRAITTSESDAVAEESSSPGAAAVFAGRTAGCT